MIIALYSFPPPSTVGYRSVVVKIRFLCKRVKSRRKRWTHQRWRRRNGSRRVERPRVVECIRACARVPRTFVCVQEGRTKGGGCKWERERERCKNGREKGCARVLGVDRTWASLFAAWLRVEGERVWKLEKPDGLGGRMKRRQAGGGGRRNFASLPSKSRRHAKVTTKYLRTIACRCDETRDSWSLTLRDLSENDCYKRLLILSIGIGDLLLEQTSERRRRGEGGGGISRDIRCVAKLLNQMFNFTNCIRHICLCFQCYAQSPAT